MADVLVHIGTVPSRRGREVPVVVLTDGGAPVVERLSDAVLAELESLAASGSERRVQVGADLARCFFWHQSQVRVRVWVQARLRPPPDRVNLLFSTSIPSLQALPWELLKGLQQEDQHDALLPHMCIGRIVKVESQAGAMGASLPAFPLRIAVWDPIQDPTTRGVAAELIRHLEGMPGLETIDASGSGVDNLAARLRGGRSPIIVHLVSHGHKDGDKTTVTTGSGPRSAPALQNELRGLCSGLSDLPVLGLVMDVCWSGTGPDDAQSPARRLVQAGFIFVMADAAPLLGCTASAWSCGFYRALSRGASILEAVTAGRSSAFDQDPSGAGWASKQLHVGRVEPCLARPVVGPSRVASVVAPALSGLSEMLSPQQRRELAALAAGVSRYLERLQGAGIRYDSDHVRAVQARTAQLVSEIDGGARPLSSREAQVLLGAIQVRPLGWCSPGAAPANWADAVRVLRDALAECPPASPLACFLSETGCTFGSAWSDVKRTLESPPVPSARDEVAHSPESGDVRHGLLASFLHLGERLDAGAHRVAGPTERRDAPSIEAWCHLHSAPADLAKGWVRQAFCVPRRDMDILVQLLAVADLWLDPEWRIDRFIRSIRPVTVLPPRVIPDEGCLTFRVPGGPLLAPAGLPETLAGRLSSRRLPAVRALGGHDEEDPFGAFLCTGAAEVLQLPVPPSLVQRRVRFEVRDVGGERPLMDAFEYIPEPETHIQVPTGALDLPAGSFARWTLTPIRTFRRTEGYEGVFWVPRDAWNQRCRRALEDLPRAENPTHMALAQATVLRAFGYWSDANRLVIDRLHANGHEGITARLPLFCLMLGTLDRMQVELDGLADAGRSLARRVWTHGEAIRRILREEIHAAIAGETGRGAGNGRSADETALAIVLYSGLDG